jgi:predicted metal-dependent peptidase
MQFAPHKHKLELTDNEVRYYTQQVEKVRISSVEKEPFLADNGFRMQIIIANYHRGTWVDTAATDGKVLIVNPNWYMMKTTGGKITVFAHELFHAALGHNLRRGKRNPMLWNIACDHEVNNLIVASGKYEIPKDWVCDPIYAGWVCERIYADLKKKLDDQPPPPKPPPGGNGEGQERIEGGEEQGNEEEQGTEESHGEGEEGAGDEDEGDGAGDSDEEGEVEGDSNGTGHGSKYGPTPEVGEVFDALNDDGSEMGTQDRKEALEELAKRNEIGKMAEITAGTDTSVGAHVSMKKLMDTEQSWEMQLGDFFASKGIPAGDTWKRLSRRGLANKQYVPGKRHHGIEWMVFAYDVSWSMERDALEALNKAMDNLRKEYNVARVTILPFNEIVLQDQIAEVELAEEMPKEFDVGGGTSFHGVFNWVRRQDSKPDGIVVFTDMGSRNYGEEVSGVPTLWASSEPFWEHGSSNNFPPFGERIEIEVDYS